MKTPAADHVEEIVSFEEDDEGVARPRAPVSLEPKMVPCALEEEQITFTAELQPRRRVRRNTKGELVCWPIPGTDRVMAIHDLTYPPFPDELKEEHRRKNKDGSRTVDFQHWTWSVYRGVLQRFVGKPLSKLVTVEYQQKQRALEAGEAKGKKVA